MNGRPARGSEFDRCEQVTGIRLAEHAGLRYDGYVVDPFQRQQAAADFIGDSIGIGSFGATRICRSTAASMAPRLRGGRIVRQPALLPGDLPGSTTAHRPARQSPQMSAILVIEGHENCQERVAFGTPGG
jgi:hypothetical protein